VAGRAVTVAGGGVGEEGGRERVSATTLAAPKVWRGVTEYSEMKESWRC